MGHSSTQFKPLTIAVLTVSDTRTEENDTSGKYLSDELVKAGHKLHERQIVIDDLYQIRAVVSQWIADANVNVIISTGGTGFSDRDNTPEAIEPLLDKQVEGFGELFRSVSYQEIGSSTIQSRAVGGLANHTAIFCLPGSTGACRTGWSQLLIDQLNSCHKPCNFVMHLGV
ncbi:MAG: Molybdenum cofactor biosynthesis protein B [Candidatus Celerinatantimonas neptuna]|nr:MAG: Molybdenum cofactor biosynthesis protein B [Candidatus Celerinatantimonas neptuna]